MIKSVSAECCGVGEGASKASQTAKGRAMEDERGVLSKTLLTFYMRTSFPYLPPQPESAQSAAVPYQAEIGEQPSDVKLRSQKES